MNNVQIRAHTLHCQHKVWGYDETYKETALFYSLTNDYFSPNTKSYQSGQIRGTGKHACCRNCTISFIETAPIVAAYFVALCMLP